MQPPQQEESEITKFRKSLPIFQYKDRIVQTVRSNNFAIITGDTGSGKSTQLPQYLIDSQQIRDQLKSHMPQVSEYRSGKVKAFDQIKLVITQPRRMAAVSMAMRLCYERGQELGQQIGYTIRFDDKTSQATRLKYVTDGIFVRECITDPYLFRYQIVILDEAHERSLYTDILFALIKKAVQYRKGTLKLIITSATLNTKTFSNYYGNCPVLPMHGKLFPVQVKYFPIHHNHRVQEAVKAAIRMHLHEGPGDILVFLTGSEQCQIATRVCYERLEQLMQKGRDVPGMIIYCLYGALSNEDQAKVFEKTPAGIRKVVFSTNIAETSLTIDNVGFVIDCGFVKQKTYNPKTNMDTLVTIPISKVQAIQRKGRAGRTQEGKCLRLYTEKFYEEMKDFATPQILRVSLTNVILTLKSMRINDVINFEYMENPDKQTIFKALGELYLLHALNQNGEITELGTEMCKFPLEPPYSKALITSLLFGVQERMITLVSLLSTQSIWKKVLRINEEQYSSFAEKMKQFNHPTGDHQTMLTAYRKWTENDMSNDYCQKNFLNFRAMRQAENIKNQLYQIIQMCNVDVCRRFYRKDHNYVEYKQLLEKDKKLPPEYIRTLLRRSLTTGFYFNSAKIMNNAQNYLLLYPQGTVVALDPTCALSTQQLYPKYVVFTELGSGFGVPIMRTISAIDGDWVLPYMSRTKDIDIFRLAGMKFEPKKEIALKPEEDQQTKKRKREQELEKKIADAKERYEQRKKLKKS